MRDDVLGFMKDMPQEELHDFLININRLCLNRKEHIKKYNKARKLHSDILSSMVMYIDNGRYDTDKYFDMIGKDIDKETEGIEYDIDTNREEDITIFEELFIYKNHEKIPSVTEEYINKKIFRNEEKIRLLNSMKNSYVGLFEIKDVDRENGFVFYEDVFTHKKFKIIDIGMSSTHIVDKNNPVYMYNRIITYDGISFGTGINCMFVSGNKYIKEFIKKHQYYKCSDFSRCIWIFELSKKDKRAKLRINNIYGYSR